MSLRHDHHRAPLLNPRFEVSTRQPHAVVGLALGLRTLAYGCVVVSALGLGPLFGDWVGAGSAIGSNGGLIRGLLLSLLLLLLVCVVACFGRSLWAKASRVGKSSSNEANPALNHLVLTESDIHARSTTGELFPFQLHAVWWHGWGFTVKGSVMPVASANARPLSTQTLTVWAHQNVTQTFRWASICLSHQLRS